MILNASIASGSLSSGLRTISLPLSIDALDRRHIERRRQIVHDRVEQRLHALVLERRAAQHRKERAGDHRLADEPLERRLVGLLALEVGGHGRVVELDRGFDQLLAIFLRLFQHIGRNVDVFVFRAERLVVPDHALHADEIDQTLELLLRADRQLDRHRLRAEPLDDVLQALIEIRADLVHLVGEDDARDLVLVALPPDRLGLRLHALVGIEHADRAVEHAQGSLDLDGEIDVAGRVDDVQPLVVPERGGRGRRDGDAAFLLLLHEIHGRGAVMHLAHLVALAGVIEDPLGRRGLAGIDVRHDAEIAVVLDGVRAGHRVCPCSVGWPVTSGSARRPGWLPPSGACLRVS